MIALGRSVLLFGTREQIAGRLEELRSDGLADTNELSPSELVGREETGNISIELRLGSSEELQSTLHIPLPPDLPEQLSAGQAAQVSELLEYLHLRTRVLVQSAAVSEDGNAVQLSAAQWQDLLDVQSQLAEYLRLIGDPGSKQ